MHTRLDGRKAVFMTLHVFPFRTTDKLETCCVTSTKMNNLKSCIKTNVIDTIFGESSSESV